MKLKDKLVAKSAASFAGHNLSAICQKLLKVCRDNSPTTSTDEMPRSVRQFLRAKRK